MDKLRLNEITYSILQLCIIAMVLLLLCLPNAARADRKSHIIIVATDNNFQQQIASHLIDNLDTERRQIDLVSPDGISEDTHNKQTLFIAIGETAIKSLQAHDKKENALRLVSNKISGVSNTSAQTDLMITQPACRQMHLIKALDQDWTSIAVLASTKSADKTAELTRCAIKNNINLRIYAIADQSDLLKTLDEAIDDNEVLLTIPDPAIYNSKTVKTILLTAYRKRIPVIGYSRSFVESGAIAAVYSSAEAISDTATAIVDDFFTNDWQFRHKTYYPEEFTVTTNNKVAKSLGIRLPNEPVIEKRIKRAGDM